MAVANGSNHEQDSNSVPGFFTQVSTTTLDAHLNSRTHIGLIHRLLFITLVSVICLFAFPPRVMAQTPTDSLTVNKLKKLSMEELMNVKVTSISMRPEKLTEVASAVQVITNEDIHRSGATRLPETLRLASNLQIGQANSHDWAITARGFNGLPSAGGILANKLLVMIDGRSIYNPLFGGVYWDAQFTPLKDLDRVEVVSGPGGTLWGANAVNGVINIVTKSAKETQGFHASASGGSFLRDFAEARYGFRVSPNMFFRVYGSRYDQKNTVLQNEKGAKDAWNMSQAGFRMDYYPSKATSLTVQGDLYGGGENDSTTRANLDGENILARFAHQFSEKSNLTIQAYFDRTWRKTPYSTKPFFYQLNTYDVDIQHRFPIGRRQSVLWGGAYRFQKDQTAGTFIPLSRNMPLFSAFLQDEITFVPDQLKLTVGSKFLHNVFSGFEIQPSARLAWTMYSGHTIWTAVSRAVRLPTRFDSDITVTPGLKFGSEKVIAYELGYRVRPVDQLSLSFATFYNKYNHLRSLDSTSSTTTPIVLANSQRAESWGFEFSGNFRARDWWHLRGGYTYFAKSIRAVSPKVLPISGAFEGVDLKNIVMLQSIMDLPNNLQFDLMGRFSDKLPAALTTPVVPAYFTFDARLARQFKSVEISLVGQNLFQNQHTEAGLSRIPRSIYGKITCRF